MRSRRGSFCPGSRRDQARQLPPPPEFAASLAEARGSVLLTLASQCSASARLSQCWADARMNEHADGEHVLTVRSWEGALGPRGHRRLDGGVSITPRRLEVQAAWHPL